MELMINFSNPNYQVFQPQNQTKTTYLGTKWFSSHIMSGSNSANVLTLLCGQRSLRNRANVIDGWRWF